MRTCDIFSGLEGPSGSYTGLMNTFWRGQDPRLRLLAHHEMPGGGWGCAEELLRGSGQASVFEDDSRPDGAAEPW